MEPARALGEADRAAGVAEDVAVRLGQGPDGPQGRLVRLEADGHVFLLFTNLADMPAELVALTYRYRWQIELFFKWLKCILGCRHWFAESRAGVTVQVYCALIASVLLVLWTGRKPTKRQWEALQLYWLGWASVEELERILAPEKRCERALGLMTARPARRAELGPDRRRRTPRWASTPGKSAATLRGNADSISAAKHNWGQSIINQVND